jgi:hypothetical protein
MHLKSPILSNLNVRERLSLPLLIHPPRGASALYKSMVNSIEGFDNKIPQHAKTGYHGKA